MIYYLDPTSLFFPAMNNAEMNISEHRHLLVLILFLEGKCQRVELVGQRVKHIL